jgi:CspA family cold shock protein
MARMARTRREPPATGTVREWAEEGWGVVDCAETPGGCWVHWSVVHEPGYRELSPGQAVRLRWEAVAQDGYRFRATWVAAASP